MNRQSLFTKSLIPIVISSFLMLIDITAFSFANRSTSQLPPIKTQITIESDKITLKNAALVTISIQNLSEEKIELQAIANFELLKNTEEAVARDFSVRGDSYWGPFDLNSGKPRQLVVNPKMLKKGIVEGRVVQSTMQIEGKGTKIVRVNLTELFWIASISSTWPYEKLFDVVPKGHYWLVLKLHNKGQLESNRVDITVE